MSKHSIQFNPSSFSRPSPTCEHIHTDVQGMELEWILCMRNYDCIQPHNDVRVSTMRGQEQECSEQHGALAVKTVMKQGQQWQWKQECPQQQKHNSAFTMKAKLWNRGENKCRQGCCTLTLKTKFHNNGDNSIENSSVHNNIDTLSL
jgi:hypothetical protein